MTRHPSYTDWRERKIVAGAGPEVMMVNSTGRCNLSCFMCSHSVLDEMPVRFPAESLDPFFERIDKVYFAGGEPFFLKPAENSTAAAIFNNLLTRHPRVKLNAFSNGTLLNEEMACIALKRFGSIHFSIDSMDPAIYAKVRGKPMLANVLANIDRLVRLKLERGIPANAEPHICFNSIVMNETLDGLPAVADKLASIGGRHHVLLGLINHISDDVVKGLNALHGEQETAAIITRFQENVRRATFDPKCCDPARLDAVRGKLKAIYTGHGISYEDQLGFMDVPGQKPPPPPEEAVCGYPWTMAHALENGDVFCCCANNVALGNLRTDTFERIWNGETARGLREAFAHGEMRGCIRSSCPAVYDYFRVGKHSHSPSLLKQLDERIPAGTTISEIVLLRTAPDYQCHLAARTLLKRFPGSRLTVVTNEAGADEVRRWGVGAEVLVYPGAMFEADRFGGWWRPMGRHHSMATIVYNNNERRGYEQGERILASLDAAFRIGIRPDGRLLKF